MGKSPWRVSGPKDLSSNGGTFSVPLALFRFISQMADRIFPVLIGEQLALVADGWQRHCLKRQLNSRSCLSHYVIIIQWTGTKENLGTYSSEPETRVLKTRFKDPGPKIQDLERMIEDLGPRRQTQDLIYVIIVQLLYYALLVHFLNK